ncbi:MAG: Methylmalonyl-CoA epimerase, partial [Thermoleophilia bacterium]|nr:Methylmalonyl-CoA epimerase [Thermoleophilia bacterium]
MSDQTGPLEGVPGVVGIHHVALAVADLDEAIDHWTRVLGARLELRAVVDDQGVEAASLEWAGAAGGGALGHGTLLELVAPHGEGSGVARFLERRGAG